MWRYKLYIIAAALLAAGAGYGLSLLQSTLYQAEGTVLLNDPRSSGGIASEIGLVLDPGRYVRNQAEVMESPQVAQRASDILDNGTTATDIHDAMSATPATNLDAITVRAAMPTADEAVGTVNAVVQAYEEIVTEQIQNAANTNIASLETSRTETEARIAGLDALIADDPANSILEAQRIAAISQLVALDTRIEQLSTNAALYGSGVQLFVAPDTPTSPIQPRPRRNAAIAFVLGALAAGAWAWWRAEQNQVADNRNIPALVLDAPLLAAVPDYKSVDATGPIPIITSPASGAAEAYQFALSSLGFALEGIQGRTVLITSTGQGDGKTATALNLAIAASHDGRKPLLIDADERVQGLTRLSGFQDQPGISDLNGSGSVERSLHRWGMVDSTGLDFVPAGTGVPGNIASFFRSDGFRSAIGALLVDRDMVIIDSPPVMAAAETTDIAAAADAIVLVVEEGTPLRNLDDARQRLTMSGTPIIGYIFNRATPKSGMAGYGYGYGYGYGDRYGYGPPT